MEHHLLVHSTFVGKHNLNPGMFLFSNFQTDFSIADCNKWSKAETKTGVKNPGLQSNIRQKAILWCWLFIIWVFQHQINQPNRTSLAFSSSSCVLLFVAWYSKLHKMRLVPLALVCVGFDLIFVQASASDDINPGKLAFDNNLMSSRYQSKILNISILHLWW